MPALESQTDYNVKNVHGANRFYLEISGKEQAVFTEIGGLQIETEVFEYMEGGNNGYVHKLPGRSKIGNLVLKHGVTSSQSLLSWYVGITLGVMERKDVSVVVYGRAKRDGGSAIEIVRYNFLNAYPVKWVGPQLNASSTAAAIETLELAHAGFGLVEKK